MYVLDRLCWTSEKSLPKTLTENDIQNKIGIDNSSRYPNTKHGQEFTRLNDYTFFPLFGIALMGS